MLTAPAHGQGAKGTAIVRLAKNITIRRARRQAAKRRRIPDNPAGRRDMATELSYP